jgi:hypothetical protein
MWSISWIVDSTLPPPPKYLPKVHYCSHKSQPLCPSQHLYRLFLAYFPYFEKIKIGLWYHVAACVCARQRLSKSALIVARQRLGNNHPIVATQRLGKNPFIIARQRLGKNPLTIARQRLGRNVTLVTNTRATIEELLDASFPMWPVSYQGK